MYTDTTLNDFSGNIYIGQTTTSLFATVGNPIQNHGSILIYRDSQGLISLGIINDKVSSITRIDG